jgi:hypothetical protein
MTTKTQPGPTPDPMPSLPRTSSDTHDDEASPAPRYTLRDRVASMREKLTTRHGWLGDYDYAWLCTPTLPCAVGRRGSRVRKNRAPPFYALNEELPLLLAITTGLQHSLAMLAGALSC